MIVNKYSVKRNLHSCIHIEHLLSMEGEKSFDYHSQHLGRPNPQVKQTFFVLKYQHVRFTKILDAERVVNFYKLLFVP